MTLFDPDEGARLRDEALARVADNAPADWKVAAVLVIRQLAAAGPFTGDDVWDGLARRGVTPPHEPRALGAVMRRMALAHEIVPTGEYVRSVRPVRHRGPVAVWKKL